MRAFIWMLLLSGFLLTAVYGGNSGKTGISFLKIAVGARAVGMGEAHTAVSNDVSATYWNPAGLVNAGFSNVLFNHNEWIEGVRGEFAGLSLVRGKAAWGFHVRSLNMGDIPVRVLPSEEPLEQTSAHYLSMGLSYARRISGQLDIGISVKYLFEKIFIESASGYAADFGLVYHTPFPELTFGATLQNLGKMNKLAREESALPLIARLGFSYDWMIKPQNLSALFALDVVRVSEETSRLHVGAEMLLWQKLALRGGLMEGYDSRNYSLGIGIRRYGIRLDYAITPFEYDFGVAHRFSMNFPL